MPYDAGWRQAKMGKTLERNYKVKEYFVTLSDEKMNTLARSIEGINFSEFTVMALLTEIIKRNPKMLLELKGLTHAFI